MASKSGEDLIMETKEYIVSAFTENAVGVLIRITAAFMRRKVNIESIKV